MKHEMLGEFLNHHCSLGAQGSGEVQYCQTERKHMWSSLLKCEETALSLSSLSEPLSFSMHIIFLSLSLCLYIYRYLYLYLYPYLNLYLHKLNGFFSRAKTILQL